MCGACGGTGQHAHFMGTCSHCAGTGLVAPATCGGCHGAGINPHYPDRACDFCGGSGMAADERRVSLTDILADTLSDTEDLDVRYADFARAVVAELERRGLDLATLDLS